MPRPLPSLTAALAWGVMFPIAAIALESVDALHVTTVRYLIASLIFVALLAALEGRGALSPDGRTGRLLFLGTLGFVGFNLLTYAGLATVTPETAALMVATTPLMTVFGRWRLTGESPARGTLPAAAVALVGVALVLTDGDPSKFGAEAGALLVLLGAACWVRYTLAAAEFAAWSPLRFTTLTAVAGTVSLVVLTAASDLVGATSVPPVAAWGEIVPEMAYIVLAGAVLGVLAWNAGVKRLGAPNAALFMNLVPVTAFAIAIARGREPHALELAGAVLTVAALIAANLLARRRAAADAAQSAPAIVDHSRSTSAAVVRA